MPRNLAIVGILSLVIIGVALLGLYLYNMSNTSAVSNAVSSNISISGNLKTLTVPITTNSNIVVTCNQCQLGFSLNSTATINLDISGSHNTVSIHGGQTNLIISGDYNIVYCQNTRLLSQDVTGAGDAVYS